MQNIFENTITNVAKVLNDAGFPPILVGGWAVNFLGFTRNTVDFDFMILEDKFDIVTSVLEAEGYSVAVKTSLYARFKYKDDEDFKYIDCLFANLSTYNKLKAESTNIELFDTNFFLPKPLHIIAMKLHAVKHGTLFRGSKDFDDIVMLVEIHNIDISQQSEFKAMCDRYADNDIYKRIKNEVIRK
jgi:hypothetical protein